MLYLDFFLVEVEGFRFRFGNVIICIIEFVNCCFEGLEVVLVVRILYFGGVEFRIFLLRWGFIKLDLRFWWLIEDLLLIFGRFNFLFGIGLFIVIIWDDGFWFFVCFCILFCFFWDGLERCFILILRFGIFCLWIVIGDNLGGVWDLVDVGILSLSFFCIFMFFFVSFFIFFFRVYIYKGMFVGLFM